MSIPPDYAHLTAITTFTSFRQSLYTQFKSRNFVSWKLASNYAESIVQSKSVFCSVECFSSSLPATIRGKFAWLGNHPSLGTRKDATVKVAIARCRDCSSKVCLSFGANEPRSLKQRQLSKNYIQLWDS